MNISSGSEPTRGHLKAETWRFGKCPVYSAVNKKYMAQRTQNHANGSLEKIVENLVKTWEMEATHKVDVSDWGTIAEDFGIAANNGNRFDVNELINHGSYNCLLDDCPKELYDSNKLDYHGSHEMFKGLFKTGFAWEVVKVYTGPPTVAFSWRHWGHAGTTTLEEEQAGLGHLAEIKGMGVAVVDANLKIKDIKVYFDPVAFMQRVEELKEKYPEDTVIDMSDAAIDRAETLENTPVGFESSDEEPQIRVVGF